MSDLDFDLDHLDFAAAEQNVEQQQQAELKRANEPQFGDDDDECRGGACRLLPGQSGSTDRAAPGQGRFHQRGRAGRSAGQ